MKNAWRDFDTSIGEIVTVSAKGSVKNWLLTMSKIFISYAKAQYGYMEMKERSNGKENRRETKMKQLRAELKSLWKKFKKAKLDKQVSLRELRDIIQPKLKSVRRAEWHRQRRNSIEMAVLFNKPICFHKENIREKTKWLSGKYSIWNWLLSP